MRICVVGAGVIGVATAFILSRMGHDVDVLERAAGVATGASHANGAQLSWSYTNPLPSPAILPKLPAYLLGFDPSMQIAPSLNMDFLKWGLSFLRNCTSARYAAGGQARHDLAMESQNALAGIERDLTDGPIEKSGTGKIVLAQTRAQQKAMQGSASYRTAEECLAIEPALQSWTGPQLGGLFAPDDYAADPVTFCERLKATAETEFGTRFRFGENVLDLLIESDRVVGVRTERKSSAYDMVVICLGNQANQILRRIGLSVPIYSVRGYSVTLPATGQAPRASVTDLSHKIVYANLGDKIRIAGFADINAKEKRAPKRIATLIETARNCWPDIADYDAVPKAWFGERPMTPSGIPFIGSTRIAGLMLNIGHGSLGYTFAAGSAQRIANKIEGVQ